MAPGDQRRGFYGRHKGPGRAARAATGPRYCRQWPLCLPTCPCDSRRPREDMAFYQLRMSALERARRQERALAQERDLAERRRDMGRYILSQYHPAGNILPGPEAFPSFDVPRSPWPSSPLPLISPNLLESPEAMMASLHGQRRNAISLPSRRNAPRRSPRRSSPLSPGQLPRRSPSPASNRYELSSDVPEIGFLNIPDEVASSRRTSRRSDQRDTPSQSTGDQIAQAMDTFRQLDAARQSTPGAVAVDNMIAMAETFTRINLPESEEQEPEEQESEDAESTAAETGSQPDDLEHRLILALMDEIEIVGKNLLKKD